ncbi:MAG: helix-turn-helix transcriptional regulator [bacterium]
MCYNMLMHIIQKLEIYRLENKISQKALAKKLGVAYGTVNRWLRRKTRPNPIQTYHIEKILRGFKAEK